MQMVSRRAEAASIGPSPNFLDAALTYATRQRRSTCWMFCSQLHFATAIAVSARRGLGVHPLRHQFGGTVQKCLKCWRDLHTADFASASPELVSLIFDDFGLRFHFVRNGVRRLLRTLGDGYVPLLPHMLPLGTNRRIMSWEFAIKPLLYLDLMAALKSSTISFRWRWPRSAWK
jgi:hypothetical protein